MKKMNNFTLWLSLGVTLCLSLSSTGCQATSSPASGTGVNVVAEKSGTSIAEARLLKKGLSTQIDLPCTSSRYVGPFSFTKDPESIKINAVAKSPSGAQICTGGSWVDPTGKFISVAPIGCPESAGSAVADLEFTYSPGNGGNGEKTVYLELKTADPKPENCTSTTITLSLP